jgi:hypothetical protein
MLSMMLLLPQPFGPTIPVMLSSKFTTVLSAKLLNPFISKLFSLTVGFNLGKQANIEESIAGIVADNDSCARIIHRKKVHAVTADRNAVNIF